MISTHVNKSDITSRILRNVSSPARYIATEYGCIHKPDALFLVALCFPDLYEIGMSNQAIKLLYNRFNNISDVACERVFAVAEDFEEELDKYQLPLFLLESQRSVKEADILAFSIGYELSATNILSILSLSHISTRNIQRKADDPIVIAGGPAMTNPLPLSPFIEYFYFGEVESGFDTTLKSLAIAKRKGASKENLHNMLRENPAIWWPGKFERTVAHHLPDFHSEIYRHHELVPSLRVVQDHGVVEIMRGCPNGCRFCHAGFFYRPVREKRIDGILDEIDFLIEKCGYREISLSSLSSGDFLYISELIKVITKKYQHKNISFSLPSLRVNSFALDIFDSLSSVRKSGLTFAVETADEMNQLVLNKHVCRQHILKILHEAKERGWKLAKFYFMIGLPSCTENLDYKEIEEFIFWLLDNTGMRFNINIGTFIPKPFTPFQWASQMTEKEALDRIMYLKNGFKKNNRVKISYHSPFASYLEGILSRGDERVADIIEHAFLNGARLDAWEEHLKRDVWKEAIANADWDITSELFEEKQTNYSFPWANIGLGVSKKTLVDEWKKSKKAETTGICSNECDHNCGTCGSTLKYFTNSQKDISNIDVMSATDQKAIEEVSEKSYARFLIRYVRKGTCVYLNHLSVMQVFERAMQRSGIRVKFTEGFNPKPKIEFASPSAIGIISFDEVMSVFIETTIPYSEKAMLTDINTSLPEGLTIQSIEQIPGKPSLMSIYDGGKYELSWNKLPEDIELKLYNALNAIEIVLILKREQNVILFETSTQKNVFKTLFCDQELEAWIADMQISKLSSFTLARSDFSSYFSS